MDSLWTLLERQFAKEQHFAPFLGTLDRSRTVTLMELLSSNGAVADRLQAPWLDVRRLTERLAAAADYFDHARLPADRGWARCPLVFLQAAPPEEDAAEHQFRVDAGYELYAKARRGLPPQVAYLIGNVGFTSVLHETPKGYVVPPLHPFSNRGNHLVMPGDATELTENGQVLGYRIPDYPSLLRVDNDIATDYFARILVHDIGHGMLPSVPPHNEALHNAAMIDAMGVSDLFRRKRLGWQKLVHAECTDPLFTLDALNSVGLTFFDKDPVKWHIAKWLRETYVKDANAHNRRLWGFGKDASMPTARESMRGVLRSLRSDGFARYALADDPPAVAPQEQPEEQEVS